MRVSLSLLALVSIAAFGCNAPVHLPDASTDAASQPDSVAVDSASDDASAAIDASADAASADGNTDNDASALPDASADAQFSDGGPTNTDILGTLYGPCGVLRPLIASPMPSLVNNQLVFMAPERYERAALSMGGQRLFDTPNAGGSSIESEIMAYEVLHFCEGASLTATETEIQYTAPDDAGANSITDLLVTIDGQRVGVSVTRIYRPAPMVLTDADVRSQLVTKLTGINRSSMRVLPAFRWVKQILSVFVANQTVADQVTRVWPTIDAATRADTIVLMTTTRGGGFIYCNPDPALGTECPSL
jgi:predicted small lipoprotein YifL